MNLLWLCYRDAKNIRSKYLLGDASNVLFEAKVSKKKPDQKTGLERIRETAFWRIQGDNLCEAFVASAWGNYAGNPEKLRIQCFWILLN